MNDIVIRPAVEVDYDFILRVNEENVEVLSPMDRAKLVEFMRISSLLWVAFVNGERAAFLIALTENAASYDSENYRWFRQHYDHFLYIDRIVIDKPFRRIGLGKTLYENVFRYTRENNIPVVTAEIDTIPYNAVSLGFHKAMGFREVGMQTVRGGSIQVSLQAAEVKKRCSWCNIKNPLYVAYHDTEWGVFPKDEQTLYELFILETFQAGLSWECILNKRENFRRAYDGFDINKVCTYGDNEIAKLMQNTGIIRNRAKLKASIQNSRVYKDIIEEFGSFAAYLESFTDGKIIREPNVRITTSPLSDSISADLKKRGMTFVGSTTIYAFLQAIGIINAHEKDCFRSQENSVVLKQI